MKLSVREFWLPKRGNSQDEYEDAFAYSGEHRRVAVADGATESSFSDRWARSLVQSFTLSPPFQLEHPNHRLKEWMEPLQHEWKNGIDWDRLPWYAIEKARTGSFAALVGLEFIIDETAEPEASFQWRALAVGDSCLFQVRDDNLLTAFPMDRAEQFNSRPVLLSSNPSYNHRSLSEARFKEGEGRAGDMFFLTTDALAQWFLAQYEGESKPWDTFCGLSSKEDFENLISRLREEGLIRNDDTTLLIAGSLDERACSEQVESGQPVAAREAEVEVIEAEERGALQ